MPRNETIKWNYQHKILLYLPLWRCQYGADSAEQFSQPGLISYAVTPLEVRGQPGYLTATVGDREQPIQISLAALFVFCRLNLVDHSQVTWDINHHGVTQVTRELRPLWWCRPPSNGFRFRQAVRRGILVRIESEGASAAVLRWKLEKDRVLLNEIS